MFTMSPISLMKFWQVPLTELQRSKLLSIFSGFMYYIVQANIGLPKPATIRSLTDLDIFMDPSEFIFINQIYNPFLISICCGQIVLCETNEVHKLHVSPDKLNLSDKSKVLKPHVQSRASLTRAKCLSLTCSQYE